MAKNAKQASFNPPPQLWENPDFGALVWYLLAHCDENGNIKIGRSAIMKAIGATERRARTLMQMLQTSGIASSQTSNSASNLTMCVSAFKTTSTSSQTSSQTSNSASSKKPVRFVKPTEQEVINYCREHGYHFNPEQFIPNYEMKGWMISGSPMKDWRAACRTWEIRWKEKYGEQFYYQINTRPAIRGAVASQASSYAALESAAETILRNAGNIDHPQDGSL